MPGSDPRSDADLLAAHVAGDGKAFGELLTRHRPRLYRLARCRSASPEDAADAVQDALLAAHRSARRFRHDAAVGSWLHRIVINACLDRLRRNAKSPVAVPVPDRPLTDHAGVVDTALMVREALLCLPVEQRAAVVAIDMYGHSIADAALILGVAEGTVKSRRSRGHARLAVLLRPYRPGTRG